MRDGCAKGETKNRVFSEEKHQTGNCWNIRSKAAAAWLSQRRRVRSRQCQGFRRNLSVPVLERALSSSAEGWELGAGGNGTRIT